MTDAHDGSGSGVDRERPVTLHREGYDYADPSVTASLFARLDGLTLLQQMLDGNLPAPPIITTLGVELTSLEFGAVAFSLRPQPWHYNPIGSVHGGVMSTLLDSAAACAVHSTLPAGRGYTSVDLTVKFLRAVTVETGVITARGRVLNSGRRTALATADLVDDRDRLVAHAVSTCLLMDL